MMVAVGEEARSIVDTHDAFRGLVAEYTVLPVPTEGKAVGKVSRDERMKGASFDAIGCLWRCW